jgi:hypothetical protein
MENRNNILMISLIAIIVLLSWGLTENFNRYNAPTLETKSCKEDSLQNVINELQMDLKMQSDGFDFKEKRYSEILFEYEYGIDHLKNYQPQAYREFHRILSHKENFNRQDEQENIKRLETPK